MINNINEKNVEKVLIDCIKILHQQGPNDDRVMEILAYCKIYYANIFSKYENDILYAMGLFYKTKEPSNMFEYVYDIYKQYIYETQKKLYTPIQAKIIQKIENKEYYSFSAPTSAGKSYVFKTIIENAENDVVIVVPSRALISEYYLSVIQLVGNDVLVLTFVDDINKSKTKRRIFILTPERAREIFKYKNVFNVELFLFDEAQITEEVVRGLKFDALVRRTIKEFPKAKKVFAEIQISKQKIKEGYSYDVFTQRSVGKLFVADKNGQFLLFSPYENTNKPSYVCVATSLINSILDNNGTILIYISKNRIYDESFLSKYSWIIDKCKRFNSESEIDKDAISLINKLKSYVGATKNRRSLFIDLMMKGIVLHHGSIPLKCRILIEEFINKGYAKLCFATSTLVKGINMPFDIVIVDNWRINSILEFKNLIGRAGRSTKDDQFNIGFVIVSDKKIDKLKELINSEYHLKDENLLDENINEVDEDLKDIVEAVSKDEFIDELNITKNEMDRLKCESTIKSIKILLDNILEGNSPISGEEYKNLDRKTKELIKSSIKNIYLTSLRRKKLSPAEESVISTSILILLWKVQCKTFREIVRLRYLYLTQKDVQNAKLKELKEGNISDEEYQMVIKNLKIRYSQIAFSLPNNKPNRVPLFGNLPISECDYDKVIYDTYDYLDKVISLSLEDPLVAALTFYENETGDIRAGILINYIKYGTNSKLHIMLTRYGFDYEDMDWIVPCIEKIDENGIDFIKNKLDELDDDKKDKIKRYL